MAHDYHEPAGKDIAPTFDPITITTTYTPHGPITHIISDTTGHQIRIPTDMLATLAAHLLTEWQDHQVCDCDDDQ